MPRQDNPPVVTITSEKSSTMHRNRSTRGKPRSRSCKRERKPKRDERHSYAPGDFNSGGDLRERRTEDRHLTELHTLPPVAVNSSGFKLSDFRDDQGQSILGNGCFGTVKKIVHKSTGEVMALKVVPKSLIEKHGLLKQMKREIQIHATVEHPHIVRHRFHLEDDDNFYLGMEYATGGGLFKTLRAARTFKPSTASRYIYEVLLATQFLHSHGIIHRDLKPENLLLFKTDTGESTIKLSDFGWSNESNSEKQGRLTFCGTLEYLAPEMVQGHAHDTSLDMWAVGVLLYEFLCGMAPFTGNAAQDVFSKIVQGRVRFPGGLDVDAVDMIMRLLRREPGERLTAEKALLHPFITKYLQTDSHVSTSVERDDSSDISKRQLKLRVTELEHLLYGKRQRVTDLTQDVTKLKQQNTALEVKGRKLNHVETNVLNPLATVLVRATGPANGTAGSRPTDTCGINEFVDLALGLEESLYGARARLKEVEAENARLLSSLGETLTARSNQKEENDRLQVLVSTLEQELDEQPLRLDEIERKYLDEIDKLKVLLRARKENNMRREESGPRLREASTPKDGEGIFFVDAVNRHLDMTLESECPGDV
ncbi:MAG: uncharacterized protein KVP18_004466 [Porospora cf. gigantea A]|uniref:uncharacterized protein n=1 Tax=Porospora cf. gigantea A TaxID=2853593 RepID=UPI00355964F7|nr:MAG: hypothetical protein KVP18_004466 [Porospora cf. gigantea A]